MKSKMIDLSGKTINGIEFIKLVSVGPKPGYIKIWECRCHCGAVWNCRSTSIKNGTTTSCGCNARKWSRSGNARRCHGMNKTPEHVSWILMKRRCLVKDDPAYPKYGGRGIKICQEWIDDFANFFNDMGIKPSRSHTLDRIDTNGDYCKKNCRWADKKQQARNRRNTKFLTVNGETKPLAEWAEIYGINSSLVHGRINSGYSPLDALSTPVIKNGESWMGLHKHKVKS